MMARNMRCLENKDSILKSSKRRLRRRRLNKIERTEANKEIKREINPPVEVERKSKEEKKYPYEVGWEWMFDSWEDDFDY